jgi:hypothetical protein
MNKMTEDIAIDASTSYHQFKVCFVEHYSKVIDKKNIGIVLLGGSVTNQ